MSRGITRSPWLWAALAICFWSTVSTAFKLALRQMTPPQLLFSASVTSTLVLGMALTLQGKLRLLLTSTPGDWLRSAALGLANPLLYYAILFTAYNRLPAQQAQALNYTWAVMLVILSIPLLHQRPRWRDLAGLLVSFTGALVISVQGRLLSLRVDDPLGVGLALSTSVIWALYWIFNMRDPRDETLKLFMNFLPGTLFVLAYLYAIGQRPPAIHAWPAGMYVGVFEMGLTFMVWLRALSLATHTARVANLIYITPFASLVIIRLALHESIHPATVAGLVLIVGGILWQQLGRANQKQRSGR
jgi:drug/metabolite transporter (DMT)-like permease